MGCKVTLSRPSDVRIQSIKREAAALERSSAHLVRKSSTRRTRTGSAPPHARDSNPCRAAVRRAHERVRRASNVDLLDSEVIVPASKVNRSARFTTGKAKTPPKWRTQEWHLSDAARAPSLPAQIHMQGRVMQAADQQARKHQQQQRFEHGSAHRLTKPLRMKNSERKAATARPGLEPESCGNNERRASERTAAAVAKDGRDAHGATVDAD